MTAPARLLTPEEASLLVGVAARTLRNKAGRGEIPHTRPAGTRLIKFSEADVEAIQAAGARPVVTGYPASPASRQRRPRAA